LKIFLEINRWVTPDVFVGVIGNVCSRDDDDAVLVLLIVDEDENVSSLPKEKERIFVF
jgi:hypothetical protein